MKVIEAINRIDNLKPNTIGIPEKVRWLSTLDGQIREEIIDTHEGDESEASYEGYTEENTAVEMIVKPPYDDIYVKWLEAQIDYTNGEFGKYNNSSTAFNEAYRAFANYYNRTHMPKGKRFKFY